MPKAHLYDRLYVKADLVPKGARSAFKHTLQEEIRPDWREESCGGCKYLTGSHEFLVDEKKGKTAVSNCAAYYGCREKTRACPDFTPKQRRVQDVVYRTYEVLGDELAFPRGDMGKIDRLFRHFKIVDQRVDRRFSFKLKINPDIREWPTFPEQKQAIETWLEKQYGILKAAPGWGKTNACIYMITRLRCWTMILVDERSIASQWAARFYKATNLKQLEEEAGRPLLSLWPQTHKVAPITISTYQSFSTDEKRFNRWLEIGNKFGMLVVDEGHTAAAPWLQAIVNASPAAFRLGLTATPERKDGKHVLLFDAVGPVTVKTETEMLSGTIDVIQSSAYIWARKGWNSVLSGLAKSKPFNKEALELILDDVEDKRFILVYVGRIKWGLELKQALKENGVRAECINSGTPLPMRDQYYAEMREGKLRVLISGKIMKKAVDIVNLDTLYMLEPTADAHITIPQVLGRARRVLPSDADYMRKYKQMTGRTVKVPRVRYLYPRGGGLAAGCMKKFVRFVEGEGFAVKHMSYGAPVTR